MKNLILFFAIIFSFNFVNAQYVPEKEAPADKLISFWIKELSRSEIKSRNTCLMQYKLFGRNYFLAQGEAGFEFDPRPLLLSPAFNEQGFIEIQNLYPCPENVAPEVREWYRKKNQVYIGRGCLPTYVDFFQEAKFIRFVWKKYPKDESWNWIY